MSEQAPLLPGSLTTRFNAWLCRVLGYIVLAAAAAGALSLLTWNISDPSLTHAASGPVRNLLGPVGAILSDLVMQLLGLGGVFIILPLVFWALQLIGKGRLDRARVKLMLAPAAVLLLACAASSLPKIDAWPLPQTVGGWFGDLLLSGVTSILAMIRPERASAAGGLFCLAGGMTLLITSLGLSQRDVKLIFQRPRGVDLRLVSRVWRRLGDMSERMTAMRREPTLRMPDRPLPAASNFQPSPYPAFGHDPQPYSRSPDGRAPDDDIDASELKRIATICAPERSGKSTDLDEPPSVLLRPEPADDYYPRAPSNGVRDAMDGAGAEHRSHGGHWPAQAPSPPRRPPIAAPADGWRPESLPGGDDLYGRAVAVVLDDRKASAAYLQQRLAIGYMRAADLIERMEREGILGAPVYNGMRPILIGGSGSREI